VPKGGCCLKNQCKTLTNGQCRIQQGTWLDRACAVGDCRPATGSCCQAGGRCDSLTQTACTSKRGLSWAQGGVCNPNPCNGNPMGSCCMGSDCKLDTKTGCATNLGIFTAGGQCSPNPCGTQTACCMGVDCILLDETTCSGRGGTSHPGAACTRELCTPGTN
jgi:hypothetical protein